LIGLSTLARSSVDDGFSLLVLGVAEGMEVSGTATSADSSLLDLA
jgi:hypothetical protein